MFETLPGFPGLYWTDNGQSVLSGPLLRLARHLEDVFLELAARWAADEYRFPAFISAPELQKKLNYLGSFPHQVTFPARLDPDPENLARFAADVLDGEDAVRLTGLSPIREFLTPATCAHAYVYLAGREFPAPYYLTCSNLCFRNEEAYEPLRRQWAFTMREVVCVGTTDEVGAFLLSTQEMILELATKLDLPLSWVRVTDPFFKPSDDPEDPQREQLALLKKEAVFGDGLAIASSNFHHDHFGRAFGITRSGDPAFTGCIAFGLERWVYAVATRHGPDPRDWPSIASL